MSRARRSPGVPSLLFLALATAAAACGKKADPSPPLPRGARAVSNLTAEQEGAEAVLTFGYPDRLLTGQPLTDLASIQVYRVVGASPSLAVPPAPPAPLPRGQRADQAPVAAARRAALQARLAEENFYREARLEASLPYPSLSEHTQGASIVFRDPLMPLLEKGSAPPLAYAVVSTRRNGERSPLSNIVLLNPEVPLDAPKIETVLPDEGRICLEWSPPEKDLLDRPASVGGYFVYRRRLPEDEYDRPLNPEPVASTFFTDTTALYGSSYLYTVRATPPNKPKIEGLPAEEVPVLYRDVYPPAAPARLDALSEASLVRLVWDPVAASDLAGYLVFRANPGGEPVALTPRPILETVYSDARVEAGKRYRYTVKAVDVAGNVSEPSPEAVGEPF